MAAFTLQPPFSSPCCAQLVGLYDALNKAASLLSLPTPPASPVAVPVAPRGRWPPALLLADCGSRGGADGADGADRRTTAGGFLSEEEATEASSSSSQTGDSAPNLLALDDAQGQTKINAQDLARVQDEVASDVQPWEAGTFGFVRHLQEAARNFGHVELMTHRSGGGGGECPVAVKRMPKHWIGAGPKDFERRQSQACEKPWCDLGLVRWLNHLRFPYVCDLLGVFADTDNMYVVTSFAASGDLFAWTFSTAAQGGEREALMQPLAAQAVTAVRWLHELGIGHRDLSLENLLLEDIKGEPPRVKVIDFAMATLERPAVGVVGKRSYQPPEMHRSGQAYDPFLMDSFALGVTFFTMATQDYPWNSTRTRPRCELFSFVSTFGFREYLAMRTLKKGSGDSLTKAMTPSFCDFLEGLLELDPARRCCLGEACFASSSLESECRRSAWSMEWLAGFADVLGSNAGA